MDLLKSQYKESEANYESSISLLSAKLEKAKDIEKELEEKLVDLVNQKQNCQSECQQLKRSLYRAIQEIKASG